MLIHEVKNLTDLADGETLMPEPDMGYELRTIDGDRWEAGTVECLVRRGDTLFARTTTGEEFAITGYSGSELPREDLTFFGPQPAESLDVTSMNKSRSQSEQRLNSGFELVLGLSQGNPTSTPS